MTRGPRSVLASCGDQRAAWPRTRARARKTDRVQEPAVRPLDVVADAIEHRLRDRPVGLRVAIDGRDGAGKTTFADRLATMLRSRGIAVVRASVDDWQREPAIRYRRGRFSPEGYYRDGFDFERMKEELLVPFAQGAAVRLTSYDIVNEQPLEAPLVQPCPRSVLVLDGVFLLRPELRGAVDFSVYLAIDRALSIERGVARDAVRSGDPGLERRRYEERYAPGQDRYHAEARPEAVADVVIDNVDLAVQRVTRR